MDAEKNILVKIQFSNNLVWRLAKERWGAKTQADISRHCGVDQVTIGKLMKFKMSPVSPLPKEGKDFGRVREPVEGYSGLCWKPSASKLAKALGVTPEYLFPEELWESRKAEYELEVSSAEAIASANYDVLQESPEAELIEKENSLELLDAISALPHRYGELIKMIYGIGLQEKLPVCEIARKYDVTPCRIFQMKHKAFRLIREHYKRKSLGEKRKEYVIGTART